MDISRRGGAGTVDAEHRAMPTAGVVKHVANVRASLKRENSERGSDCDCEPTR